MPLFQRQTKEEQTRDRVEQLIQQIHATVRLSTVIPVHPWYYPWLYSVISRAPGHSGMDPELLKEMRNEYGRDALNRLSRKILDYLIDRVRVMPDAEVKLDQIKKGYGFGTLWVWEIQDQYGVSGLGQAFIAWLAEIHKGATGIPWSEDLAINPRDGKKVILDKNWR